MNFIMIGLLHREALDRLCVRLNMSLITFYVSIFLGKRLKVTCGLRTLDISYKHFKTLLKTYIMSD